MLIRHAQSAQDEVESLNADVMRFMAILGLCLMLIFAAMEGVRVAAQTQNTLTDTGKQQLQEQQEQQQQEQQQIQVQMIARLQQQLHSQQRQVEGLEQQNKRLLQANQYLQQQAKNYARQQTVQQTEKQALQGQLEQLKQRLQKQSQAKQLSLSTPGAIPVKAVSPKNNVQKKVQKKGYVLRFSDDKALIKLVRSQQVSLIMIRNSKLFKVNHQPVLRLQPFPGQHSIYRLDKRTVPVLYQNLQTGQENVQWGVILPPAIVTSLKNRMARHSEGILEINASGQVSIF